MHGLHQPFAVGRAVIAQINPNRHGNQRGQPVHHDEAQNRHFAADAGGHENRRAQAGQEAGDKQHPVAVFFKFLLHLCVTFRRHYAGNGAEFKDIVAPDAACGKYQTVAGQHSEHADDHHDVHVGITQARNDASGNQGNVFGNRNAETAGNQYREYGCIPVLEKKTF